LPAEEVAEVDPPLIVIIGGSSGIGLEVARQVRTHGARLILVGRDHATLVVAAEQVGKPVTTLFALDAHDEVALERFFAEVDAFDHLVSMVGDSMGGGFLTTSPETMRHVLHSKFWTNWMIGRYAAPKVRDGGSLTFTAGTGGSAHEISASYVANLGIAALVQGLAAELAPRVRVNAVAPTFMGTATAFWRDMVATELEAAEAAFAERVPLKRLGTVEDVASTYVHLMMNRFITGQVLAVDGGVMLRKG
jgi:NAD(P)-dependent dehydrogenase (short-subunit alcohol dehydrogenase family)